VAGTFTVTVAVTDDDGGAGNDTVRVVVQPRNRPPVAVLQGPSTGKEGDVLTFSGAGSSDPDGDVLTDQWMFSDGASASGPNVTHAYGDNGSFTVPLKVSDPAGLSDTKTSVVTIANVAPVVDAGPDASVLTGDPWTSAGRFTDPGAD